MKRIAFAAFAAAAILMAGQAQAANEICQGDLMVVRVSKLKPGATFAQFDEAVAAHMAWYRSHGYTKNTQTVSRVLVPNEKTRQLDISPDLVLTVHHNDPSAPSAQHDAAWTAYVAKYRAVSDIQSEQFACEPKN